MLTEEQYNQLVSRKAGGEQLTGEEVQGMKEYEFFQPDVRYENQPVRPEEMEAVITDADIADADEQP